MKQPGWRHTISGVKSGGHQRCGTCHPHPKNITRRGRRELRLHCRALALGLVEPEPLPEPPRRWAFGSQLDSLQSVMKDMTANILRLHARMPGMFDSLLGFYHPPYQQQYFIVPLRFRNTTLKDGLRRLGYEPVVVHELRIERVAVLDRTEEHAAVDAELWTYLERAVRDVSRRPRRES